MARNPAPVVDAYRILTGKTRAQATAYAQAAWMSMDSWSDEAADRLVGQIVPAVIGAERQTASATIAYLEALTGVRAKINLTTVTGSALRRGADPREVYRRPIIEARATYSREEIIDLAVEVGMRRLLGTVETDLQLAATHTANQALAQAGVETYRMVARAGACPLCVAASDNVYTVGQLQPLHSRCHCVTVPGDRIPKGLQGRGLQTPTAYDPELDKDRSERRLVVDFNEEIGPVLDWSQQSARANTSKRSKAKRGLPPASPTALRELKRNQLATYEQVLAQGGGTDWMRAKVAELRAELRT